MATPSRQASSLRPGQFRHVVRVAGVTGRMPERDQMLLWITHTTGIRVTELVRGLRNRIAHHEPVFQRNLDADYARIERLVGWRCPRTKTWMNEIDMVRELLKVKP